MAWHSFNKIIRKTAKHDYLHKNLEIGLVCNAAERAIMRHCAEVTSRNARAVAYEKKVLTIAVTGATYAQDIRLNQRKIIRALNQELEEGIVTRIKYKI